jgi:hypothetical protein
MSPTARLALLVPLAYCLSAGCAQWDVPSADGLPLPPPRMSPDSVVLEIAFVRYPPDETALDADVWRAVDEMHLPAEQRRVLAENGVRCGLVGASLPVSVRELLDQATAEAESTPTALAEDAAARIQRMHCREGVAGKIVTRTDEGTVSVLTCRGGAVEGRTFAQATCQLRVTAQPADDGRVQLELVPEVEYGEARPRYVGNSGVWAIETSRQRQAYPEFKLGAMLSPGESLVLGGTPEPKGLGGQFFTSHRDGRTQRVLLLVRLQQTQSDGRFEPAAPEAATRPVRPPF